MMDSCEATNVVLAKLMNFDPENANRIMGILLIALPQSELIRLSHSPDHVLHAFIHKVKANIGLGLGLSSTTTPLSPSPLNPIARPTTSSNPFSNGFDFIRNNNNNNNNPPSPSSPFSGFPNNPISPNFNPLLSYKNIRSGFPNNPPPNAVNDFVDEQQLNDYFSFLNESSSSKNEDLGVDPGLESLNNGDVAPFHKRSYSASDACFESEEVGSGIVYKPCLYFARGNCKNGSNCKFHHADLLDAANPIVGSPSKFEEIMRLKEAQQRMMLAASSRLMAAGVSPSPSSHDQYINYLMQQQPNDPQSQRVAAAQAALMMGEEFFNIGGRSRPERHDYLSMISSEKMHSASRQIYLTFPAESTFKDEDVSEYFSKFGPVQDVRIPYQPKRMFGFVTFVFPETVRDILAKGNPHFICDSRVLVKPYKEKGKASEKRQQQQQHQQQQFERGDFSPGLSPSGFDSKEPYDLRLGARMFYNPQEMILRRRMEQVEFQKALDLQERRIMNLQLPDFKNNPIHHHQRSLSVGSPLPLQHQLHGHMSNAVLSPDSLEGDIIGYSGSQAPTTPVPMDTAPVENQQPQKEVNPACFQDNAGGNKKDSTDTEVIDKSLEQVLSDSLPASPTKAEAPRDLLVLSAFSEVNESGAFSTSSSTRNNLEPLATSSNISSQ